MYQMNRFCCVILFLACAATVYAQTRDSRPKPEVEVMAGSTLAGSSAFVTSSTFAAGNAFAGSSIFADVGAFADADILLRPYCRCVTLCPLSENSRIHYLSLNCGSEVNFATEKLVSDLRNDRVFNPFRSKCRQDTIKSAPFPFNIVWKLSLGKQPDEFRNSKRNRI
ncbi:MAG: hypothetical protein IJR87_00935 [Bacteroidaceae bacterium]|nr:hypothetical protein [Bacteroidaceae bacterium]